MIKALLLVAQLTPWQQYAKDTYKQLIEINTNQEHGITVAATAMRQRLLDAGFAPADVHLLGEVPEKQNLVARLRSARPKAKPILLLAHLDVVDAKREDWSFDPFVFREVDGYFYGRGTTDDKAEAAIHLTNFVRLKKENVKIDRDVILVLSADEETGDYDGAKFLVEQHRDLVDAAFGINEGGGGEIVEGKHMYNDVQASEKVYLSFYVESFNPGGHSSRPVKDNAIYHVAEALTKIAAFDFPAKPTEVTRAFFANKLKVQLSDTSIARLSAESPYFNALLHTTCVATRMEAGHADNALPQTARATVNCRLLPGEDPDEVQRTLERVVADDKVKFRTVAPAKPTPPSPLSDEIMKPVARITQEIWPGVEVVPVMGTGATDALYFRKAGIPVYGVSGVFEDVNDNRAHGKDERLAVKSFFDAHEFLWRLTKSLTVSVR